MSPKQREKEVTWAIILKAGGLNLTWDFIFPILKKFLGKNKKISQLVVLTVFQKMQDPCGSRMSVVKPASVSTAPRDQPEIGAWWQSQFITHTAAPRMEERAI